MGIKNNSLKDNNIHLTKKQIKFLDKVCGKMAWTLNSNGEIDVDGDVYMENMNLTEIPVKFGIVCGNFICTNNKLTTLKNYPHTMGVTSFFHIYGNNLTEYFKSIKESDFTWWEKLDWLWILEEYPFLINIAKRYLSGDILDTILFRISQTKEFYVDNNIVVNNNVKLTKEQIKFLNYVCVGRWFINPNGEVDVDGFIHFRDMNLTEIPVKFGMVSGYVVCSRNQLKTLKNLPKVIGGTLDFRQNNLTDYFKNIKEEDFPHWDKLYWETVLEEYPFLINIGKKYISSDTLKRYLMEIPQTKEFYIKDETKDIKNTNFKNSIKIENGIFSLSLNQNKIEFELTEKTNFTLNF